LKFSSYEGIERGASKDLVYNGERLLAANPSRLYVDAETREEWRKKGFFPVLHEKEYSKPTNWKKLIPKKIATLTGREVEEEQPRTEESILLEGSMLFRSLYQKKLMPQAETAVQRESFTFSTSVDPICPTINTYDGFARVYPHWGMPYGLPALREEDYNTIVAWLAQGSPAPRRTKVSTKQKRHIRRWEKFLNGDSLKERLMSRYIFEHLFLGHIYFSETGESKFFELIRSKTPPGKPVERVVTRRVFDDPGVARVYYRFVPVPGAILAKRHLPYALNEKKLRRFIELFLQPQYEVRSLPSYEASVASNPFIAFADLPVTSRYKFMLDEAEFTIGGFIKGPVCRGQTALNVIDDQFWVFFFDPDRGDHKAGEQFLRRQGDYLQMPAALGSNSLSLTSWLKYSESQKKYLQEKRKFYERKIGREDDVSLDLIWDGDRQNKNAALTIFRHFDSASVVKGLHGQEPKTVWVLSYSLLERIHYLLVAGFDVFGNVEHQLLTRLYMDFLRMEGESHFLALLPVEERKIIRDYWYRGASEEVKEYVYGIYSPFSKDSGIEYKTNRPKSELLSMMAKRLGPARNRDYSLSRVAKRESVYNPLLRLQRLRGKGVSLLPQVSLLRIPNVGVFSVIRNDGYTNVARLFFDKSRRVPEEDTLSVVYGYIGDHPNAFYNVTIAELEGFVDMIEELEGERDYQELALRYGVTRDDPGFWAFADILQSEFRRIAGPLNSGLLDFNRLETR
jgi:hypothetical protein